MLVILFHALGWEDSGFWDMFSEMMLYVGSWRGILDPCNLWHFGEPYLVNIFAKEYLKMGSYSPNKVLENFHGDGETRADKHIIILYLYILTHPQRQTTDLGFQGCLAVDWVMPLPYGCCTSSVQWPKTCAISCMFLYCCCWLRIFGLMWYPPSCLSVRSSHF